MPNGRVVPPTTITHPQHPYPQYPPVGTPDESPGFSREWVDKTVELIMQSLRSIAAGAIDRGNRVDEFRVQGLTAETLTTEPLLPDYQCSEIIEAIVVTGPTAGFGNTNGSGRVATPGAATQIAVTPPGGIAVAGLYTVEWAVGVEVAAAAVADNFQLTIQFVGVQASSDNPIAVGVYQQNSIVLYLTPGQQVVVRSNLADATGTYSASIVVTAYVGSTGIPFTLVLGKRTWNLQLPPTGILAISPVNIKLSYSDVRQLSSSIAGNWSFELTGYAETGSNART